MQIAIVGGTGALGEGIAVRTGVHTDHEIVVGSRDEQRARTRADRYRERIEAVGEEASVAGESNAVAASRGEIVVLSVPPYHVRDAVDAIADGLDDRSVLVTPAVGIADDDGGVRYDPPSVGSVTELVARTAPSDVPVVGAFHSLPAERLADPEADVAMDVPLVGDDPRAKERVEDLIDEIRGLRPVDAGPAANAPEVESLAPLLINVGKHDDSVTDVGVQFR